MANTLKFTGVGILGLNLLLSGFFILTAEPQNQEPQHQPGVGTMELLREAINDTDSLTFAHLAANAPQPEPAHAAAPAEPAATPHEAKPQAEPAHAPAKVAAVPAKTAPAAPAAKAPESVPAPAPAHAAPAAPTSAQAESKPAPAAKPKPKAAEPEPEPLPVAQCFKVGPLRDIEDAEKLIKEFAEVKLTAVIASQDKGEFLGYWVYLSPERSMALARLKVEELKTKGITDVFLVKNEEPKRAISLGVYRNKLAAQKRQRQLRDLGYDAELDMRYKHPPEIWLLLEASDKTAPSKDGWKLLLKKHKGVKHEKSDC